jgi:hypothetical protein
MINLNLSISNPWRAYQNGRDYFANAWLLNKNKSLEVQVSHGGSELLEFGFSWNMRTDHAGIRIVLGLFYRFIHVNFYDIRHWNDEKGRYVDYSNPEEVKDWR